MAIDDAKHDRRRNRRVERISTSGKRIGSGPSGEWMNCRGRVP
jgi:hypothetical protein